MSTKIALAAFAAATLVVGPALAQETTTTTATATTTAAPAGGEAGGEKEFGNPGTINFGAKTGLVFDHSSVSPPAPPGGGPTPDSQSTTTFQVTPEIAYFVAEGISVGGEVLFQYVKPPQGDSQTAWGIGPAVGYNLWLTPGQLSLWPQVEFLYVSQSETITVGTSSTSATLSRMSLGVFVPLLIHPVKHFHFGVGPYFSTDLSSKASASGQSVDADKTTSFGVKLEIAGWL